MFALSFRCARFPLTVSERGLMPTTLPTTTNAALKKGGHPDTMKTTTGLRATLASRMYRIALILALIVFSGIGVILAAIGPVTDSLINDAGNRVSDAIDTLLVPAKGDDMSWGNHPIREAGMNAIYVPRDSLDGNLLEEDVEGAGDELKPNLSYDARLAALDHQIEERTKAEKRNSVRLAFRRSLIHAATSEFYVSHFVNGVVTKSVVRPTPEETGRRAKALAEIIEYALTYARSLTPKMIADEKAWLETCQAAIDVERRAWWRKVNSLDVSNEDQSAAFDQLRTVSHRFDYNRAGKWTGQDIAPKDRDYRNLIKTFVLRRIWTDGMSQADIVSILTKFSEALKPHLPRQESKPADKPVSDKR